MPIYGIDATDIDELARELEATLKVRLYANESPIIGTWYSSHEVSPIFEAIRAGDIEAAQRIGKRVCADAEVRLTLNNTDPYYGEPDFPGGGGCILALPGDATMLGELEAAMRSRRIAIRRLK